MNLPNVSAITSIGGRDNDSPGLGSLIKLVILLGAQLLLVVVWLLRLAIHYSLLLASFLRFSHRLYVELRNDNVERDVIQSADTDTTPPTQEPPMSEPTPCTPLPFEPYPFTNGPTTMLNSPDRLVRSHHGRISTPIRRVG